jgi:regulator of replication initiation timing
MSGAEFETLVNDISTNGLNNPIVLHDGFILDGGNRYRACIEAYVEPTFTEYDGGNPVLFVLSANLHRRHLTPGQNAAIVASAQNWAEAHGQGRLSNKDKPATLQVSTVADRVASSGASERTQLMADKVAKQDPELAKSVGRGEISLPKAEQQLSGKVKEKKTELPTVDTEILDALEMENEQLHDAIESVSEQNELLKNIAACAIAPEELRDELENRLNELTAENKKLRYDLEVMTDANNRLTNQCATMQEQMNSMSRRLMRAAKNDTAS